MKKNDPIFEANPTLESYHKTSDGQCFYQPSDAKNHANSLKNRTVTEVKNANHIEVVDAEEVDANATKIEVAGKVEGSEDSGTEDSGTEGSEETDSDATGKDAGQVEDVVLQHLANTVKSTNETESALNSVIQNEMAKDEGKDLAAEKKANTAKKAAATKLANAAKAAKTAKAAAAAKATKTTAAATTETAATESATTNTQE